MGIKISPQAPEGCPFLRNGRGSSALRQSSLLREEEGIGKARTPQASRQRHRAGLIVALASCREEWNNAPHAKSME
jgi:hypothetical protein